MLGDITRERLGMSAAAARALHKELTGAFHLAAVYDLAVKRDLAMRINVQGTKNVLEFLADARGFERLHYVSTAYVSGTAVGIYRETDLDVVHGRPPRDAAQGPKNPRQAAPGRAISCRTLGPPC